MKNVILMSTLVLATFLVSACTSQPNTNEPTYNAGSADPVFHKKQMK